MHLKPRFLAWLFFGSIVDNQEMVEVLILKTY